ncbi:MAG TPA: HEAT repeat domain-containing protein, partial [Verrucomicrobiae bacterium]|nr:HEAT repeat domain-containing protein [Verrucomicrobiae bacterium]
VIDANKNERLAAVYPRGRTGSAEKRIILALADRLADDSVRVRAAAATVLGGFGSSAADSLPALQAAMADDALEVRTSAERAVLRITTGEAP